MGLCLWIMLTWNILLTLSLMTSSSRIGSLVLPTRSKTEPTTSSISSLKKHRQKIIWLFKILLKFVKCNYILSFLKTCKNNGLTCNYIFNAGWTSNHSHCKECNVTHSKSNTLKQEVGMVSSIVLLLTLIGHDRMFISFFYSNVPNVIIVLCKAAL